MNKSEKLRKVKKDIRDVFGKYGLVLEYDLHSCEHFLTTPDIDLNSEDYLWFRVGDLKKG